MKYMIIAILVILALLTLTKKETNKTMTLLDNNTILAFGDSLTYGYGAKVNESYPSILSDLTHMHVLNAGVNGETSDAGARRLPQLLQNSSIKLMILCFGGNDILQKRSISSLKQNLKAMIQMAKSKNIEVLLISVPNLSLLGLSPLALYEEVAEEENIPLLDGVLSTILSDPLLKSDQIHPNALGYKMMADRIYAHLKTLGWIAE
jgi:lysophospholipase L1-like esterase